MAIVSRTITAADQFTDWLNLGSATLNPFVVVIRGSVGSTTTVVVQAKRPGEADGFAAVVKSYTGGEFVERGTFPGAWEVRIGLPPAGNFSTSFFVAIYDDNS